LERDGRKGSETREEEVTPPRPVSTTGVSVEFPIAAIDLCQ